MQTGSGAKNPPWARSNVSANMTGLNPQIMDANAMMTQQSMLPFQQTQVFNTGMIQAQGGMAMPITGQMQMNQMAQGQMYPGNVVAYPTPRTLNPGMYQTPTPSQTQQANEQRVFTGTVTKTHNDFGFVDQDVFYQTSVCAKGVIPKVNDRVLVEATYNPSMPFKWNATRVQILPKTVPNIKTNPPKSNTYNAVPPPMNKKTANSTRRDERRDDRNSRRDDRKRSRTRSRSRSRDHRDSRNRRESPQRKRPVVHQPSPAKHVVRVPKIPLDIPKIDVPTLSQRYSTLYIPSDFFNANVKWGETFPPQSPFSLNNPCAYHIMSKEVPCPDPNTAVLEPLDADYRFSAKVMLISMPSLETLYQKCGLTKVDEKDKRTNKSPLHPTRLIKFLVGQKGKVGENFAIGGPWSPSLDGDDPQNDPGVLIKTAIRTCKALTGIDLSQCTQWYRMVEFYYWRESGGDRSRLECVVLFLPDVWSTQPSKVDWATVEEKYKAACETALRKLDGEDSCGDGVRGAAAVLGEAADKSQIDTRDSDVGTITIDENDDDDVKPEPSHYSKLDLKTIKVDELRHELRARNVSCKGLRAQLVSRLAKLIKVEEEGETKGDEVMEIVENESDTDKDQTQSMDNKTNEEETTVTIVGVKEQTVGDDVTDVDMETKDENQGKNETKEKSAEKEANPKTDKEIEEDNKKIDREKQSLKSRYELPSCPHIIVHPSASAKGGRFSCNIATLSLLLDYRITDNKEHSFELFVFAELFNEMLMRDFGFYIYKTLYTLPEKVDGKKEKDSLETAEKKDERRGKDDKDDRKDDKRDSRRRERSRERRDSTPEERAELPPDPYLLLSLVYFDTARGGAITRKELHALFMSLGLQLARSQTRALLDRVCHKDVFSYKTLIQAIKDLSAGTTDVIQDLPLGNSLASSEVPPQITELEVSIATGNRDLLPLFNRRSSTRDTSSHDTLDVTKTGVVMYDGRAIEVGALVAGAQRWAGARARLEAALESARAQLRAARAAAHHTQQAERGAHAQLADLTAELTAARARITSLTASSKIFHATLKSIQTKVEAVVNIKYEDDDVVEIVNGPAKSEKDSKDEKSETTECTKTGDEQSNGEEGGSSNTRVEDGKGDTKESDIIVDLSDRE